MCTALDVPNMGTRGSGGIRTPEAEAPGLQPGPVVHLGNTPVGGPTRRRLGGSSSPPARWAGAMRPAPRPGGRSGVRSPIEHRKVALGGAGGRIPVLGRFAIEFSKTMHTRLLLVEASVWCGSPSGRWFRFVVQSGSAVEPGVWIAVWPIGGWWKRWAVRPPGAGTESDAGDWVPQASARFGRLSPRSRREARKWEGPTSDSSGPGDQSSWCPSGSSSSPAFASSSENSVW